jgi:hypothetical protein
LGKRVGNDKIWPRKAGKLGLIVHTCNPIQEAEFEARINYIAKRKKMGRGERRKEGRKEGRKGERKEGREGGEEEKEKKRQLKVQYTGCHKQDLAAVLVSTVPEVSSKRRMSKCCQLDPFRTNSA